MGYYKDYDRADPYCTRNLYISFVFFLVGVGLIAAAFATPYWMIVKDDTTKSESSGGLWESCNKPSADAARSCNAYDMDTLEDWHKATQAMMCLGLIFAVLTLFGYVGFYKRFIRYSPAIVIACQGLSAVFAAIGAGIYGDHVYDNVGTSTFLDMIGWSWWLVVAAACIELLHCLGLIFFSRCQLTIDQDDRYYDEPPASYSSRQRLPVGGGAGGAAGGWGQQPYAMYRPQVQPRSDFYGFNNRGYETYGHQPSRAMVTYPNRGAYSEYAHPGRY